MLVHRQMFFSNAAGACALGVHLPLVSWITVFNTQGHVMWLVFALSMLILPAIVVCFVTPGYHRYLGGRSRLVLGQLFILFAFALLFFSISCDHYTQTHPVAECISFIAVVAHASALGVGLALSLRLGFGDEAQVGKLSNTENKRRATHIFTPRTWLFLGLSGGICAVYFAGDFWVSQVLLGQVLLSFTLCIYLLLGADSDAERACDHSVESGGLAVLFALRYLPLMRQLFLFIAWTGGVYMGTFLVLLPYFAETRPSFALAEYSLVWLAFSLGLLIAHFAVSQREPAPYPVQNAIFSLLYMALIYYALSRTPTNFGLYCLVFFWGLNLAYMQAHLWAFLSCLISAENSVDSKTGHLVLGVRLVFYIALVVGAASTASLLGAIGLRQLLIGFAVANVLMFVVFLFGRHLWRWQGGVDA